MSEYQLTATDATVIRTADSAHIPNDMANRDWVEYQDWLSKGGVPDPYVIPPLTRRQEADALIASGLTVNFTASSPGLGTYPVVSPFTDNYNAISTRLANGDGFPNNMTVVPIFDLAQTMHNFNKVDFGKFCKAVTDFIHNCNLYAQGEMINLPPNEVTF